MAEFLFYNTKIANTSYITFEQNSSYNLYVSLKDKTNPHLESRFDDEIAKELKYIMFICQKNLFHAQEIQN